MLQPDYVTVDDLKRYLRIPGLYQGTLNTEEDVYDDIPLALAITSASRAIDNATGRQFGVLDSVAEMKYVPEWNKRLERYVVDCADLMTASGMILEVEDTAYTDFTLFPYNASVYGDPWTLVILGPTVPKADEVDITAKWGWTEVPDTIKNATLLQAARFFKRRDAPFGVAGSVELGTPIRLFAKVDPDVNVMVRSYKRWYGGV